MFDYQEQVILSFLAHLYVHQQLFNKFVNLAEELGTRRWMPVELLAKTAISHHEKDLALAVYEAALKGKDGMHRKYLLGKYEELKS